MLVPHNAGKSYNNDCAYLSSVFVIVVDVPFGPVCVIRQYAVNIWCIARKSLRPGKRARRRPDRPYTDRLFDSAEFFSKYA
mgnify:CR=1 FL=1